MINEKPKQCKSKDCHNPVLKGKYCENCKKRKRENRNKYIATGISIAVVVGGTMKKGIVNTPKIASKAVRFILRG